MMSGLGRQQMSGMHSGASVRGMQGMAGMGGGMAGGGGMGGDPGRASGPRVVQNQQAPASGPQQGVYRSLSTRAGNSMVPAEAFGRGAASPVEKQARLGDTALAASRLEPGQKVAQLTPPSPADRPTLALKTEEASRVAD